MASRPIDRTLRADGVRAKLPTTTSCDLNMGLANKLDTGKTHAFGPGSVAMLLNHFFRFNEESDSDVWSWAVGGHLR
jgi:hypothetical protein